MSSRRTAPPASEAGAMMAQHSSTPASLMIQLSGEGLAVVTRLFNRAFSSLRRGAGGEGGDCGVGDELFDEKHLECEFGDGRAAKCDTVMRRAEVERLLLAGEG